MIDDIIQETKTKMNNSISALVAELAKIRAGRAHPSLLEHLTVTYYGKQTPLNQVANVNASDARTLTVTPWEKDMVSVIEKAIMESDLGLNPNTAGLTIRIPFPPLTEERRKELVKVIKHTGENSKISIRNSRRDANTFLKELLVEKEISQDDEKRAETLIQKLTDEYVLKIDQKISEKQTSLMEM